MRRLFKNFAARGFALLSVPEQILITSTNVVLSYFVVLYTQTYGFRLFEVFQHSNPLRFLEQHSVIQRHSLYIINLERKDIFTFTRNTKNPFATIYYIDTPKRVRAQYIHISAVFHLAELYIRDAVAVCMYIYIILLKQVR